MVARKKAQVQTAELEIEDDSVPAALYYTIVKVIGQNLDISILSEQGVVCMMVYATFSARMEHF